MIISISMKETNKETNKPDPNMKNKWKKQQDKGIKKKR